MQKLLQFNKDSSANPVSRKFGWEEIQLTEQSNLNGTGNPSSEQISEYGGNTLSIKPEKGYNESRFPQFDSHSAEKKRAKTSLPPPDNVGISIPRKFEHIDESFPVTSRKTKCSLFIDENLHFGDSLRSDKLSMGDMYQEEEEPRLYPWNTSGSLITMSQGEAFGSISSPVSKDEFLGYSIDDLRHPLHG